MTARPAGLGGQRPDDQRGRAEDGQGGSGGEQESA
jgi:hypothetical protein